MQKVSLRIAIYHIVNGLTSHDVAVSIDGAHITQFILIYGSFLKGIIYQR